MKKSPKNVDSRSLQSLTLTLQETVLFWRADYDLELNPVKRRAVLAWLQTMRQRGVPVHGLGLQMYISIAHIDNTQLADALHKVQQTDPQIHLFEIDSTLNPLGGALTFTPNLLHCQADKLAFLVRTYQESPRSQQFGLTF